MKNFNETLQFTRRYPDLREKQRIRDSKIAKAIVQAWDVESNGEKVLQIFTKEHRMLSNPRYWEMLKIVWICCGTTENTDLFRKWMKSDRGYKSYFMTPEEKLIYDSLPQEITCYRACNGVDNGISYTFSKTYAEHYQQIFQRSYIIERVIDKKDCFAYINRNAEDELIIL